MGYEMIPGPVLSRESQARQHGWPAPAARPRRGDL
jgi:hypothetical protein